MIADRLCKDPSQSRAASGGRNASGLDLRRTKTFAACALATVLAGPAQPAIAVIDCSKARTNIERLLCSNDKVAVADQMMALAFRAAFYRAADREALVKEQERWRRDVRDACNDVPCLLEAYRRRTSELETY